MTKSLQVQLDELRADVEDIKAGKHAEPKRAKKKVPDPAARGVRTFSWVLIATPLAMWLNPYLPHLVDDQRKWLTGTLAAGLATAWAAIEDKAGFAVLRQTPPTSAPVVDN